MNFLNNKAIYEQMADRLADEIVAGKYPPGGRIPSVREYAALLQVNTNTAVKSYELLAREGIIFNKRGMGYFVAEEARHRITERRKDEFISTMLPELFRQMRLLDIGIEDVVKAWENKGWGGKNQPWGFSRPASSYSRGGARCSAPVCIRAKRGTITDSLGLTKAKMESFIKSLTT